MKISPQRHEEHEGREGEKKPRPDEGIRSLICVNLRSSAVVLVSSVSLW
jgi:hypothetical protein